jgi:O-methyltransferase
MLAMVMALQEMGAMDRELYLFDTFEGMTEPTEHDTSPVDDPALETWKSARSRNETAWPEVFGPGAFDEDSVRELVLSTGYPPDLVNVGRGRVEDTIPDHAPGTIAVLRLDTDWYESTRHELEHLYPRLSPAGVLIVDDYGHWDGARRAVDEHMTEHGALLLGRVDYSCRIALKH